MPQNPKPEGNKIYDLEERTAKFGEAVIKLCLELPKNEITTPLITQLVKSGTAIGALYAEADDAESAKDFKHKIGIGKKEARETKHWLRMLASAVPLFSDRLRKLWQEAKELHLIFNAIVKSVKLKLEISH
ncbi:four helix bundle protein [Candidatus Berkelbacteria bacterium]|nr:four helix bundle protein [Candidatus Berkelbacteria bacterium]